MAEEKFTKENSYTLRIESTEEGTRKGMYSDKAFDYQKKRMKIFNFLSAQITTETETWVGQWYDGGDEAGATSIATTSLTQNFNDVQSTKEIELMHEKLTALKGTPPPLEEILGARYFPKNNKPVLKRD